MFNNAFRPSHTYHICKHAHRALYGMKIASRLIHLKNHVSLISLYLFIKEFAPSLSPLSCSISQSILNIWFQHWKITPNLNLLVAYTMLFIFEFSIHVNFFLPFSQVSWSSPLHPFLLAYVTYYECARPLVPWVLSNSCIKNLKTQSFFCFVFAQSYRKLYSCKWHFTDKQIPSVTSANRVQSWDWIQDPASLLACNITFTNKVYVPCCKM